MAESSNPYSSPAERHPPNKREVQGEAALASLGPAILGLRLVFFGLIVTAVTEAIWAANRIWFTWESWEGIITRLQLLSVIGGILALSGVLLCFLTPRDVRATRALRIAAASAACIVAIEAVRRAWLFVRWWHFPTVWREPAYFAGFVLTSTLEIAFLIYLKRLAWFVHRRNLVVASQRMIGLAIAMIGFQFWQAGYANWIGRGWQLGAGTAATEQIRRILQVVLLLLAAALVHGIRKAMSVRQIRRMRMTALP
ncbi:MAG TPA: hypothetical protein VKB78_00505 [Pirellulales bacterium]|nr:hypothetical protein [Pirellulales bacterium]